MTDILERKNRTMIYLGAATSTCPYCLSLINAKILTDSQRVYFEKYCPHHGHSRALISEDLGHYLKIKGFARAGSVPHGFSTKVHQGCPYDCGLCPDHEQHTCHPIIEITDHCNYSCPICMGDNQGRGHLPPEQFLKMMDGLIALEGRLENVTLSGGEPSLHPDFWELVAMADRPEVSRISLVTNGLRIAEDMEFCRRLKDRNIYVILQWDGLDDDAYLRLRGRRLLERKQQALSNLEDLNIATQLIFVAARGVNEGEIGQAVRMLIGRSHVLSLVIQPLTFPFLNGRARSADSRLRNDLYNPVDRLTVSGVIKAFAQQVPEILREEDFFPLPCPNPECVSLTYLLRLDDGRFVPFPRFVDMTKHLHLLSQSATLEPNQETEAALHEIIHDLWSTSGEVPDSEGILRALRRVSQEIFSGGKADLRQQVRISERQAKSIFIHHYMDAHTFDLARVMKCCHHYPRPNGRLMPVCSFNLFYRKKEDNPFVA